MIPNSCTVLARYTLISPVVKNVKKINEIVSPYRIKEIVTNHFNYLRKFKLLHSYHFITSADLASSTCFHPQADLVIAVLQLMPLYFASRDYRI